VGGVGRGRMGGVLNDDGTSSTDVTLGARHSNTDSTLDAGQGNTKTTLGAGHNYMDLTQVN
jgi:hypothetical protein